MKVRARTELGGDWNRFRPCDQQFRESCNPTLIPQLSPDMRFGVQVAGTILDRVKVDVDFDQTREFDAANRINIFYEGAEDDILRRLEVGDVTFRLPASRFLTEGIPAGNFGFQAEGQVGSPRLPDGVGPAEGRPQQSGVPPHGHRGPAGVRPGGHAGPRRRRLREGAVLLPRRSPRRSTAIRPSTSSTWTRLRLPRPWRRARTPSSCTSSTTIPYSTSRSRASSRPTPSRTDPAER